ncbi:MAG: hypothetical protein ACRD2L_15300 [Terriglobia bacterium]
MSQTVTVELSDSVYDAVKEAAKVSGCTPAGWIASNLPHLLPQEAEASVHPQIPNEIFVLLQQLGLHLGKTTKELVTEWLARYSTRSAPPLSEEERQAAWELLQRHCGTVSLGHATGADNESIDADLAREYGSLHEGQGS